MIAGGMMDMSSDRRCSILGRVCILEIEPPMKCGWSNKWECCKNNGGSIAQAKLAQASKTSKKIADWAKNSKVQPCEPAFRGQITKIILRNP